MTPQNLELNDKVNSVHMMCVMMCSGMDCCLT